MTYCTDSKLLLLSCFVEDIHSRQNLMCSSQHHVSVTPMNAMNILTFYDICTLSFFWFSPTSKRWFLLMLTSRAMIGRKLRYCKFCTRTLNGQGEIIFFTTTQQCDFDVMTMHSVCSAHALHSYKTPNSVRQRHSCSISCVLISQWLWSTSRFRNMDKYWT